MSQILPLGLWTSDVQILIIMIILGLDPGTTRIGYGLINKEGSKLGLLRCGVIEPNLSTSQVDRLLILEKRLTQLIKTERPNVAGVEKLYFAKNKKTALGVAEARGVMLLILGRLKIPILEFDPTDVKRAVAGDGHCDKKALAKMVCLTLEVKNIPGPDDVSDAVALAIRASFNY